MPKYGDTYNVELKKAHLEWGTHRHTSTRGTIYGEGYLQIPIQHAKVFDIYNSNKVNANTIYNCNSLDGFLKNVPLKASGSSYSGYPYAKQFQGSGDLKLIGDWYHYISAVVGDRIKVFFTSPTDMLIEKI